MAVAEIDVALLSSFCTLPQGSITTLLDTPTVELVRSLYQNLTAKARDYNDLASGKLKLEVELENAVRGGESKTSAMKNSVDRGLKEAADLREKIRSEEASRASIENELQSLKSSLSTSNMELSSSRLRIAALESSNRDTLSLLESKSTSYDNLAAELNTQHQRTIDLRREVSTLEQSVQAASTASTSSKFHEQGLEQEIESLKRSNDWLDKELKTKSGEYSKYRKEKGLRIAELQRQYDDAVSTIDSLNRTETIIRRRLDEVSQKADDSFARIQQLEEQGSKKDESFKVELDAAIRLTELTRKSASTERQRQQELFAQLESAKEDASEQIGRFGAEFETEHREREIADAKIAELEVQIEELQSDLTALHNQPPLHSSPPGMNDFTVSTPTHESSLFSAATSSPSRIKGVLSFTQLYSNYNDLKKELDTEKRQNQQLSSTLDNIIQDLETRQPEIEELRADHTRLELEVAEMSSLVDIVGKERDIAVKGAKKWEGQAEAKVKEGEVLRQQLRDLSSQIKVFLMEVNLRDQGLDEISVENRAQFERLAQGQIDGDVTEDVTDTDRLISENLVTFRNIAELQEQNMSLLKITREVGERMEHEEVLRKQNDSARDWEGLQKQYERCKDEVKSLVTQSQSYIRERDMYRRMLSHRAQLPPGTDASSINGESVHGDGPSVTPLQNNVANSVEDSTTGKDFGDYARLYKDMQEHFDSYRQEAATDRMALKQQVDDLSKANGELRGEAARNQSQVALARERYEMLQANYKMLKSENTELQKRLTSLSDSAARQDMKVQQVVEDLVEAKGIVDSLRNETANLKAEKDFWKTVEKRITEDNESLLNERSRLNSLNGNLQSLLNEREHSDSEGRRRLQAQADDREKELQTTKKKFFEATEEAKRSAQRREYEHEQSQKRIDDLMSSLSTIREDFAAAKTSKDYLSTRVDELTIELRSAEERANVFQSGRISRQNTVCSDNPPPPSVEAENFDMDREQKQLVLISELKRDLGLVETELDNVKGQVEQYKSISQRSENELLSLNDTHDVYRQEMDRLIEEKESKLRDCKQRLENMASEFDSTNSEMLELRTEKAEYTQRLEEHKRVFEAELAQMKNQDDRHAAAAQYYQEDLKVQAEIATQAQQNYENELVKHADAAKVIQKVREDFNQLKLELIEVKTEADSARANLSQSEESWADAKEQYAREIAELRTGRENLAAQNNRLHEQLDGVTRQISSLSKHAPAADQLSNEGFPASDLDNLREVIKYLRREKEIVDVQLNLSSQEAKRLKQQLDYTQSQLDGTRLKLDQQRRIEADFERTALDHKKLMDTINELNTYRESNVILRTERSQAQTSLAAQTKELEDVRAQVEPLQAEILELKNERETHDGEAKLLKENCDRWQQRAQNVLQKYDRVDPAELEALKEQLKSLEVERDNLLSSKQELQEQVEKTSHQANHVQEQSNEKIETMRTRLTDQFKARSKQLSDRIKEKDLLLHAGATEKHNLEQQVVKLSDLQNELEIVKAEREKLARRNNNYTSMTGSSAENGSEDGQVGEGESSHSVQDELQSAREKLEAAESRANSEESESANLRIQLARSQSTIAELEEQIKGMQAIVDSSNTELRILRQEQPQLSPNNGSDEQITKLREDLAQARQDADNLRTIASMNASLASASATDGPKTVEAQIAERVKAVRAELETRHNERIRQADETLEKRTNTMRVQLTKKLTDGKAQLRQSLTTEHEQAIQTLKTEYEQEIEKLHVRHKDEFAELQREEASRSEKLREAWDKEHEAQNVNRALDAKHERETSHEPWRPSDEEARALVKSNEVVRAILRQNVATQVNKTKDEMSSRFREEHEKTLADKISEAQNKANAAKEHAVLMEGKKNAALVNMANNKVRISQLKLEIIQKAAQETPQKPVVDVWATAKDAKPPQPSQDASKTPKVLAVSSTFGQPTSVGENTAQQKPDEADASPQVPNVSTPRRPPLATTVPEGQSFGRQDSSWQKPANSLEAPTKPGPSVQQNPHPAAGTGPSVAKGQTQSGLPVARGGSIRGTANSRVRGPGLGRGGPQALDTSRPYGQQQARGSPTGGGFNAGAKQFVPGNKRPREDSSNEQQRDEGNGKRVRGGGAGS